MHPIFEAIARAMGAAPKVTEAVANGAYVDPDEDLFRRLTGRKRDLSPIEQDRARQISLYLYRRNPMAKRIVDLVVDFIVGDGFTLRAEDERAQQKLDAWWTDPLIQFDLRHRDLVLDLLLMGELSARVNINPQSGNLRLGFIDPERVHDLTLDPENVLIDRTLWLRPEGGADPIPVPCVVYDDTSDPTRPAWVGEVFYTGLYRVLGQSRGTPFLLAIADYLDGYDQLLFNSLERSALLNSFIWDVTLKGADDATIAAWVSDHGAPPPPGSTRAHNEAEAWQALSPSLGAADVVELGRSIKNMGLGGAGLPEAWFAEGDSANRATLAAQGDPTYRMLASLQRLVRSMFERYAAYQLYRWRESGQLAQGAALGVTCEAPELSARDTATVSAALPQVTNALMAARAEEFIDRKSARKVFLALVNQLGLELDPDEVEQAIEDEAEETSVADDMVATQAALERAAGVPRTAGPLIPPRPVIPDEQQPPQPAA